MDEKIQKILSRAGHGSRRAIERLVSEQKITVNGQVAKIGDRVKGNEQFRIDGKKIIVRQDITTRVIIYHKPLGQICTRHDPQNRPTVFENLPKLTGSHWVSIGRLDINSSGLLLFTNDGELANRLMHPSRQVEREYAVRILGTPTDEEIQTLQKGIPLEEGPAKFDEITAAGGEGVNKWYHVVLNEGKNREIRRLWEAFNYPVNRLIRIRYGKIILPPRLRRGKYINLDLEDINLLLSSVQLPTIKPEHPNKKKKSTYQKRYRSKEAR